MTLTIFKNDKFETIGFHVTDDKNNLVYRHGVSNGWSKSMSFTPNSLEVYHRIMLSEQRLQDLERFRSMFFEIAKENEWYNNQPVRMNTLEDEIENEKRRIKNALKSLY